MSMENMKLHKMEEWESVFHTKQIEHVYYTSDMLVRKVTGYIIICRKSLNNGISKIHPDENESDGMAMDVVTTSTTIPVCVTTTYTSNLSFIKPANT